MDNDPKRTTVPPAPRIGAEPAKQSQSVGGDHRVVRTVDLTEEDIASIEASEMAPGFEYLNAELDEG